MARKKTFKLFFVRVVDILQVKIKNACMNASIKILGTSALGLPLVSYEWGPEKAAQVLILAGVHGNEVEGVTLAWQLLEEFQKNYNLNLHLTLIPQFNPDGILLKTRGNGNGVDLNRNLSTKDWQAEFTVPRYNPGPAALSEPENKALVKLLDENSFRFIFSLHSWNPLININGDCGKVAEILNKWTGYPIEPTIGYPTPGSLGTFTGQERNIPTITYEIERGLALNKIREPHLPAYLEALQWLERSLT